MNNNRVKLGTHAFVTKLAGFEHSKYIQHNATHEINDIPLIIGRNIKGGKVIYEFDWYIPNKISDALPRSVLNKRCILIPYVGNLGELAIFKNDFKCHLGSNVAKVELIDDIIDLEYLYYYLKSSYGQSQLLRDKQGSVQANITMEAIRETQVVLLEKKDQQKIANILSTLDAKIELNQRINTELESMAKTLYDYWFVQNSTVGKTVGKREIGKLGEFIKVNERNITKDYPHKEIEYIDIASVSVGYLDGTTRYMLQDAPSRARRLVKHGDTIWSTVRPNRKSYLYICNPKDNLVVSTGFAVLTPERIPPSFLYFLTTTEQFVNYLVSNAEGSTYPAVSADRFAEMEFSIPPEDRLSEFEKIVSPMLARISQNELESKTLAELRNWLLPILMNGQVKVD